MAGLLDAVFGSNDPSTADPNTGLVEAQRRQLAFNSVGNIGAILLAAGQNIMPAQRAQLLSQLGNVPGNTADQATQMSQQGYANQRNIAARRQNQQQMELQQYTQTPEFQKQFDNLPPAQKAVANAALKIGDMGSVLKALQEAQTATVPKFNADGTIYIQSTGQVIDPIRGTQYNINTIGQPGNGIAGVAGAPGMGGATGDDFLKTVSPAYGNQIKAYSEGRQQISPQLARSNAGQRILNDISQYDPTFDQTNYAQRHKAAVDFAPQGKTGQAIIQNNTVIEHAQQLLDYARKLDNSWSPTYNAAANLVKDKGLGESPVNDFNAHKLRLVDEMAKLLKGGQGAEGEINRQLAVLSASQSPSQLQSGIEGMIEAAEKRKSSQLAQYETAMGRKPNAETIHAYHNPEAEAASAYVKANPLPGSDRHTAMQEAAALKLQGGAPPQGGAPAQQGQKLSPADAAKLPPGTPFIGLDGVARVKH